MARLDPRARAMLRTYRSAKTQTGARRDALWSRIESSLDAGSPGPSLEPRPAARAPWVAPAAVVTLAVAAAVIAVVTLGPWGSREADPSRTPTQTPYQSAPPQPEKTAPAAVTPRAPGPQAPETSPSTEAPAILDAPSTPPGKRAHRDPGPASPSSREPAPVTDELQAEMALIRRARQALQAGRAAGALEVLDAHARAFPRGQMREDRQVLRIEALCAADKAPQARAEVRLFLRAFPGSAHATRVRAMCAAP